MQKFWDKIQAAKQSIGGGRARLDSLEIRRIVAADPETAGAFVVAACKDGNFQLAVALAAAYQVEFQDDTLMEMVRLAAQQAGEAADQDLARVSVEPREPGVPEKPEIRVLQVTPDDLTSGNVFNFVRLFSRDSFKPPSKAKALRGNCLITFPLDNDPRPVIQIPSARTFIQRLHQNVPHFPYFLVPDPRAEAMFVHLGCLAPESCYHPRQGLDLSAEGLVRYLLEAMLAVKDFARHVGDDGRAVVRDLLAVYPAEIREELLGAI
jgi:hypothetical protein